MKKYILKAICFLSIFTCIGCGSSTTRTIQDDIRTTESPDNNIIEGQMGLNELPKNFEGVLSGEDKFVDAETNETYTMSSYTIALDDQIVYAYWGSYIVADLDQDGENELIVQVNDINNPESANVSVRIFDLQKDTIYCYSFRYRAVLHIYADGVIEGSSGAQDNILYTITFDKLKSKQTRVAESISHKGSVEYYIGKKEVTKDEFNELFKKYSLDKSLLWSEDSLISKYK